MEKTSILDFVLEHVEKRPEATAALVKTDGKYNPVTWKEVWEQSQKIAAGLIALGIEPNDKVCLISHSSLPWVTHDIGIMAANATTVPIYPSNLAEECTYIVQNSEAKLVFAQDADQTAKFIEQRAEIPDVKKVVQMEGEKRGEDDWVLTYDEFVALANDDHRAKIGERTKTVSKDTILTIIYTSGTTGRPKGVVLTHANMVYEAEAMQKIGVIRQDDTQLLFLPLAHVFAKVLEVGWFATGHVLAFAESMQTIKQNLGEVRPTLMAGVPRVFEKFYAAVVEKGMAAEGLKKKMFVSALELSAKNGEAEERGESLGMLDAIKFNALRSLVFSKVGQGIMETMGGRMRVMVSGGAPLSKKIAWFFRDAGLLIVEGYGMTETSAATCVNLPHANQIGTVGPALPGTEIKIAEDGEILVRGGGVMREYWKNPEATKETLDAEGYLHTGDIGEVDPKTGGVRITDRKKDLIITAGGKNVAPQKIEGLIKVNKLISQVVVHGDKRKFLSALITLDEEQLIELGKQKGWGTDYKELTQHDAVKKEVQSIVDDANSELASFETIKKFKILDQDFSIETGEMTPKLSVKRKVVNSKHGHIFDAFYEESY